MFHSSSLEGPARGLRRAFVVAEYVEEAGRWRPVGVEECPFGEACRVLQHDVRQRKTGPAVPLVVYRCAVHRRFFTVYPPGYAPYARQRLAPLSSKKQVVGAESPEALWRGSLPRSGAGCRAGPAVGP